MAGCYDLIANTKKLRASVRAVEHKRLRGGWALDEIERLQSELDAERLWIKEGRKLHEVQHAEIERLRVTVDKMPKCWGLKDGKLVQDVPVVPGMVVWRVWPDTAPECESICEEQVMATYEDGVKLRAVYHSDGHWETLIPLAELFSTRKAAETAKGE